jgi:protein-disulfide isomerase
MKNEPKKSSGLPLIIIGAVLVVAVIGGYALYTSSKGSGNTNRASGNTNRSTPNPATAPIGANPPNMMGSPTASVTVEEFADFQCPACGTVNPVIKEIKSLYGNRIKFIFRNFPLMSIHPYAYEAAVASEAARMQDPAKFWAMSDKLFENQQTWAASPNYRQMWEGYAQEIGLDVERFKADMAGSAAKSRVDADLARGRGLSIDSTPALLVNGKNVPLQQITVANLRQVIDAEIQNAIKTQPAANNASAPAASPAANTNTTK